MRTVLLVGVLAIAQPAFAQTADVDELPGNDPVFIQVPTQDRDDTEGGSIFREIEPVPLPQRNGQGQSGGFIDRAFGTGEDRAEPLPRDGGFSPDWFEGEDSADAAEEDDETTIGRRRFKEAPTRTSRLFGPNMPSPLPPVQTVSAAAGELRRLDKMTGQTDTLEIEAGSVAELGRLRVALDACRAPAGDKGRGTMAYLRIWDSQMSDSDPVFSGWMFAESPALSAMDHPRYDVWVLNCEDATADAAGGTDEQG